MQRPDNVRARHPLEPDVPCFSSIYCNWHNSFKLMFLYLSMEQLSWVKQGKYSITKIKKMYDAKKLVVNKTYQRSIVWSTQQKQELIESILDYSPIGVLVLWTNKNNQIEIMDGQQRITTIISFLEDKFSIIPGEKFSELDDDKQAAFGAYHVFSLELEQSLSPDQVSTVFIRLQEGTRLSNGEKLHAFNGKFRNAFIDAFFNPENAPFFSELNDRRFKARFLAAKLLLIELSANYKKSIFPSLAYEEFKKTNNFYKRNSLPNIALKRYRKNIQFLGKHLAGIIEALKLEELVSAYMLVSYFTQKKTNDDYLGMLFRSFIMDLKYDLAKFQIYGTQAPQGMTMELFDRLKRFKELNRQGTTPESLEGRFEIMKKEWENRVGEIKEKDEQRLFTYEQKLNLFFLQRGLCSICNKKIKYKNGEADHIQKHEQGGKTTPSNGRLVHHRCHVKIHQNEK